MDKKNLVIFFGGKSVEHDVSIITGAQAVQNADPQKYNIIPIYVSQEGCFYYIEKKEGNEEFIKNIFNRRKNVQVDIANGALIIKKIAFSDLGIKKIKINIAFPTFHGTYGEDGSFQGLMEMADVPYIGSDVSASVIGMSKNIFKKLMRFHQISILPWQTILQKNFSNDFQPSFPYPVIVKPINLGSSIGVKKANNFNELKAALDIIFHLDFEALVEPYLENIIEINCSILGSKLKQDVSVCEQPFTAKEILSFEDKYLRGGKKMKIQGMANQERRIPAPISEEQTKLVQNLAKQVFNFCGCSGVARVDFMIDKNTQKIFVNEINTIPGSLSFYLWEASGISFQELIDKLVDIAIKEYDFKKSIQRVFRSPLVEKYLKTNSNKDRGVHSELELRH